MSLHSLKSLHTLEHGTPVHVAGWVRTTRQSRSILFIEIHDGSQFATTQCVIDADHSQYSVISKLTIGSSVRIHGQLKTGLTGKHKHEIAIDTIIVEGMADSDYPLQKKRHSFEFLRTIPHLRPRSNTFYAVFKTRSILTQGMHKYLESQDVTYIQAPAITTTDAEGGGDVFRISTLDPTQPHQDFKDDIFKQEAFLNVTGQIHIEPFIQAFQRVYTFGPSFRAEKSNTSRHVSEFWQVEPELAYVDLVGLMDFIESMSNAMIQYVLDHASEELAFFDEFIEKGLIKKLQQTVSEPYGRISYSQAIQLLVDTDHAFTVNPTWETGIQSEHEHYLTDVIFKKPVFVTDYPKDQKAFYMKLNDDQVTVAATDLLFPKIGEIVGASERETRLDVLQERIKAHDLDEQLYTWYLDTRRYGTVEHSGFGLGIERFMRYITGMDNIRDVIPYPRTPGSADF
ncbi:asparagine--tRNA ligase [Erysipelothrix sp. HDW6B]|uniref:asparagine--tRNA ligase n=1 Tax=Erysipelothrix sp. HDW6B TaxID=2714929 RepID=UPI00140A7476|nr:asparagine--tRNA ligase [Erysipelothrix sp. HDW6B]QIK86241.1 asparagine--tRNA ligase [Erysipelothrix sp. HDW6B]